MHVNQYRNLEPRQHVHEENWRIHAPVSPCSDKMGKLVLAVKGNGFR